MIKVSDVSMNGSMDIVTKDTYVDAEYGIGGNIITVNDLIALVQGKCLYFSDGEYAHIIALKMGDGDDKQ